MFTEFSLVCLILLVETQLTSSDTAEKRLFDDLFDEKRYNPLVRPVRNSSQPILIKLAVSLLQIIDVVSDHLLENVRVTSVYITNKGERTYSTS